MICQQTATALGALFGAALLLGGCAMQQAGPAPTAWQTPSAKRAADAPPPARADMATRISPTPRLPPAGRSDTLRPAPPQAAEEGAADIVLNFEQIPLPAFVQAVYGTILKANFQVDQKVADRRDLITLRSGQPLTAGQLRDTARQLLKSFGVAVIELPGLVRIVPDNAALGYLPEIRRGRALPETPLPMRPVFQLVELEAVKNTEVAGWIKNMFGNRVTLQEDPSRNAVMLSGQGDNVQAALEAIHVLDQPLMRGRQSLRISPVYWSAEDLAKRLGEVLAAEGYQAASGGSQPIILLPVPPINSILAFAASQRILDHVVEWARELDRPNEKGAGRGIFSYTVQYTDADHLARTLGQLLGGLAQPAAAADGKPAAARPAAAPKVVVDRGTNTLIFQGGSEDYSQLRALLQALDRPAKEALIEVTVAEVNLTDNSQLGVEWLIKEAGANGSTVTGGTLGGLAIGTSGLVIRRFDRVGDLRLLINALASNNRATILSTPHIVARNGETATIQVGQEVPIITSQQTSPTTGATGSLLQTVQYKNTGVILTVKPVIHAGGQVDLEIKQEVSAAQSTNTGVSASPTFGTRRVETRLSLKNGSTVLLGGLISSSSSSGNAGIPLLKEVPLLGQLFRTDTEKTDRTELIVLITPYVIEDDSDAQAVTETFRQRMSEWVRGRIAPPPLPAAPDEKRPAAAEKPPAAAEKPPAAAEKPPAAAEKPPAAAEKPPAAAPSRKPAATRETFARELEKILPPPGGAAPPAGR
jgi:general secretion pathway protein D